MADILPTLTDDAVMDFIASGYIRLDGVISDAFNRKCTNVPPGPAKEFVGSPDFLREVLLHPTVAGAVRSLLGHNFLVPTGGHHHLFNAPYAGQDWHSDGISGAGYEIKELQCYYYPSAVGIEDGPTIILPGSHCRSVNRDAIAHYGDLLGQLALLVIPGSVVLTRYGIWHKAGPKFTSTPRSMIKFSYHRKSPPKRDWLIESETIPEYVDRPGYTYASGVESYRDLRRRIRTWNWLCGLTEAESMVFDRWRPSYETGVQPVEEITIH
ncbi:MAG: phytanoyl-CoA dioxygenase family protein [candidate division Zixibacteria bacterium]|nr:phytanoyl-CoA dioxygenase family protein [candidate division Zixibacteria bacterium]